MAEQIWLSIKIKKPTKERLEKLFKLIIETDSKFGTKISENLSFDTKVDLILDALEGIANASKGRVAK